MACSSCRTVSRQPFCCFARASKMSSHSDYCENPSSFPPPTKNKQIKSIAFALSFCFSTSCPSFDRKPCLYACGIFSTAQNSPIFINTSPNLSLFPRRLMVPFSCFLVHEPMCEESWWTRPCVASVAHFSLLGALSRFPELALVPCFILYFYPPFLSLNIRSSLTYGYGSLRMLS